jgi:hypothetical protein
MVFHSKEDGWNSGAAHCVAATCVYVSLSGDAITDAASFEEISNGTRRFFFVNNRDGMRDLGK